MSGRRSIAGGSAPSEAKPASLDSTSSAAADAQGLQAAFAEMEQAMTGLPEHPKLSSARDFASKCPSTDADPLHGGVMDDPIILASGNFVFRESNGAPHEKVGEFPDSTSFFEGDASDSESSRVRSLKRQKMQNANAVLEEIEAINRTMIDTKITVVDDSGTNRTTSSCDGTTIKLSYTAVAISQDLRFLFALYEKGVVTPAKLYVPLDYPRSSPTLIIDKGYDQLRKESSTISDSVHMKFPLAFSNLPEPRLIKHIALAWEACVRDAVTEYAQQFGGGTFSSKFGRWKGVSTD